MIKEQDERLKVVIEGSSGVGKSSLQLRFCDDIFNDQQFTSIGVDFRFKRLEIDGKKVTLQIWDACGQQQFRRHPYGYYKGIDGVMLVYDVSSTESFEDIDKFWIQEVDLNADKNVELILLGNKSDIEDKVVTTKNASDYAASRNMAYMEVSAKTGDQVSKAFIQLTQKLIAKKDSQGLKDQGPQKIGQQTDDNKKEKNKCY